MADDWKSKGLYEHPAKHQAGTCGYVVLSKAGVYALRVGGSSMSCPQEWAEKIHKQEQDEIKMGRPSVGSEILPPLTVPENLKKSLEKKAASLGLSAPDARREAYRHWVDPQAADDAALERETGRIVE